MLKTCSRCGKVHPYGYRCNVGRIIKDSDERRMRSHRRWREKSEEVRAKANYLCEVCRDNNIFIYDGVEVHHIVKIKDNKDLFLDNYNLVCLCQKHHKEADNGKMDDDYLRELARRREDG